MADEVISIELAERFGQDPRQVRLWSAYDKNWIVAVIEEKIKGQKYRREIEEAQARAHSKK